MAATPTTNFDTSRIRFGDMIAGISGFVLFISLFLHWYNFSETVTILGQSQSQSQGFSGWTVLSFIDILLFIIAALAVAVAVLRALNTIPRNLPASPGLIVLGLGALAVLLVLFRLISIPHAGDVNAISGPGFHAGLGRSYGIFIALLAAIGVAVGGWLTWNEEGQPRPGGARVGAGGPGPLGTGQQNYGAQPGVGAQPYAQPQAGAVATAPAQTAQPAAQQQQAGQAKADWYPDPRGEKRLRYYDGTQWTDHTAD